MSIVLLKVNDFKKKAVVNSISANIKILQDASDRYYLNEEVYPTINNTQLTLSSPQRLSIEELVKSGYLKKDLDTSKTKQQFYWVDVFGRVWGATEEPKSSISLLKNKENKSIMEFSIDGRMSGFDIYETKGYDFSASKEDNLFADISTDAKNKYYKVIDSVLFKGKNKELIRFELPKEDSRYLISFKDEYGLETAPFGKFNTVDSPVYKGEGVYQFKIESEEEMFWIDFSTIEDTPGNSSVTYRFRVEKDGKLLDWKEDFFSLPSGEKIIIELNLKGDNEGNYPTVYDIHAGYKFKDIDRIKVGKEDCQIDCYTDKPVTCPNHNLTPIFYNESGGHMISMFYIDNKESINNTVIQNPYHLTNYKIKNTSYYIWDNGSYVIQKDLNKEFEAKCGYALFEIQLFKPMQPEDTKQVCGTNRTTSKYGGKTKIIAYNFVIDKNANVVNIENTIKGVEINSISYELSVNGQPYGKIYSISEIVPNSCLNVIYEVVDIVMGGNPPIIHTCKKNCEPIKICVENCKSERADCQVFCGGTPPVEDDEWCKENNCEEPLCLKGFEGCENPPCTNDCTSEPPCEEKCSPVKNDPEWVTVSQLKFFGHGPIDRMVRWHGIDIEDNVIDKTNTRIVYNYARASSSGGWSNLYENFEETGVARSVMAVVFFQVKTEQVGKIPDENLPKLISITFENELGDLPVSMTNPTLVITPKKDNNKGRDSFSDLSNITWEASVADPRGLGITNIEWSGDKRDNYPVGEYLVKAQATNERGYKSDWVSFNLVVLQEKPVAVIKLITNGSEEYPSIEDNIRFSYATSYDPDGDRIVDFEWKNKKDVYDVGYNTISLRVKDSEGYWSDWTDKTLYFSKDFINTLRIEAESLDTKEVSRNRVSAITVENTNYSEGKGVSIPGRAEAISFYFKGNGFDAYIPEGRFGIEVDGVIMKLSKEGLNSIRNLPEKEHTVRFLMTFDLESKAGVVDYIDVYSENDLISITETKTMVVNELGAESEYDVFSSNLGQVVRYYYRIDKNHDLLSKVVDINGKTIKTFPNSSHKVSSSRNKHITWDGTDSSGVEVENGVYFIELEFKGLRGTVIKKSIQVEVKNEKSVRRIEAEGKDASAASSALVEDSSYSNGQGIKLTSAASSVTFLFKGDGFDVKIASGTPSLEIDGKVVSKLKTGINSIRNITNKDYKVRILGANTIIDYVDVYDLDDTVVIENTDFRIANENKISNLFVSNVFSTDLGQSAKLSYTVKKYNTEKVEVFNNNNKLVRTVRNTKHKKGDDLNKVVYWDGKGGNGSSVPNGQYTLKLTLTGVLGTVSTYEYEVEVRNETPVFRIEAESNYTSATKLEDAKYSNNNAVQINTYGGSTTFQFTGTGFDVKLFGKGKLEINGIIYANVEDGTISIRNLPNQAHKVRILKESSSSNPIVDYLDFYK